MIKHISIAILFGLIVLTCASCLLGQTLDLSVPVTLTPSATSRPNCLRCGIVSHLPTSTAIPHIPQTPGVLDCAAIVQAHQDSTAEDWGGAKLLLRGSEFYYTGRVTSVTETDAVHMSGSLCHITLHNVPHDVAVSLTKGQLIEGYGTIASISYYLGEDVDVEVNPDLLFVR